MPPAAKLQEESTSPPVNNLIIDRRQEEDEYCVHLDDSDGCCHSRLADLDAIKTFTPYYIDDTGYLKGRKCVHPGCTKGIVDKDTWNTNWENNRAYFCKKGLIGWMMDSNTQKEKDIKASFDCNFILCAECYCKKISGDDGKRPTRMRRKGTK